MVLITDDRDGGGVRVKQLQLQHQQQKVGGSVAQVHQTIEEEPPSNSEEDYPSDDEDYDEEEDEFEEVDFVDLDDCRIIASDDSFYLVKEEQVKGSDKNNRVWWTLCITHILTGWCRYTYREFALKSNYSHSQLNQNRVPNFNQFMPHLDLNLTPSSHLIPNLNHDQFIP